MPAHRGLKIPELDDLLRQWRFEPAAAARRQLERIEAFWSEVFDRVRGGTEAGAVFPLDYVLFRITGVRPDDIQGRGGAGAESALSVAPGAALLADLCVLIERLSVRARVTEREARAAGWLSTSGLCSHWNVSAKTIARYRALGLPARRVLAADGSASGLGRGRQSLYFSPHAVERFGRAFADRLSTAAPFSRVEPAEAARLYRRARLYRARFGWSLSKAVERLSVRHGRSAGAVRRAIEALDAAADHPVFTPRARLGARGRDQLVRAVLGTDSGRAGRGLSAAAHAAGVSRATAYRVAAAHRATRLRALGPDLVRSTDEHAGREAPDCPVPNHVPPAMVLPRTLGELIDEASAEAPAGAPLERAWAEARIAHLRGAAVLLAGLDRASPSATALDGAETQLRTASRLKALLMWTQFGLALRTLAGQLARAPDQAAVATSPAALRSVFEQAVRSERGTGLTAGAVDAAIAGIAAGVERFDPRRGGQGPPHGLPRAAEVGRRLAAPVAVEVNRAVSAFLRASADQSARAPRPPADQPSSLARIVAPGWAGRVDPWQPVLDLPEAVAAAAVRLREGGAAPASPAVALGASVLILHHGLINGAGPWLWPITLSGAAEALGVTRLRAIRAERAFVRWAGGVTDADQPQEPPVE